MPHPALRRLRHHEVSIGQLFIAGVIRGSPPDRVLRALSFWATGYFVRTTVHLKSDFVDKWLMKDTLLALAPVLVLLMVIAFYLIVGMFLEPASMIFITLPTLFPLVSAAGYDLVWFGIIFTITMEIAVLTPPVGLNLHVLQGLAPRDDPVSITDVIIGCVPFIVALAGLIILLLAFPQLALWLPEATR